VWGGFDKKWAVVMESRTGQFRVAGDRTVFGELRIAGRRSLLTLRDEKALPAGLDVGASVTGTLHDLQEVTLVDCIMSGTKSKRLSSGGVMHSVEIFPHLVVEGRERLVLGDACVVEISFSFEDASAIFYDSDAFGTLFDGNPFIQEIVAARKVNRTIETGPEAQIAYFTGKIVIVEAPTVLGNVAVRHNPSWSSGGPSGVRIDNSISVSIAPAAPLKIGEAVERAHQLLRFIDLAAGRRQTVPVLSVVVRDGDRDESLQVNLSHHPLREDDHVGGGRRPHPADLPLDGIRRRDEFVRVLQKWLETDAARHDSRVRFNDLLARPWQYTVDELVSAANMFDILPASAVPKEVKLTAEVAEARRVSKELFLALEESDERRSLLDALGRIGQASLKQKVRHRAAYILGASGVGFKDLEWVCDRAIDCRNYLVHGGKTKFKFWGDADTFPFLTDTLKFVFAGSELVEAGWDMGTFLVTGTSMTHFMGEYKAIFAERVARLRKALAP
jgi:hypothetical protein